MPSPLVHRQFVSVFLSVLSKLPFLPSAYRIGKKRKKLNQLTQTKRTHGRPNRDRAGMAEPPPALHQGLPPLLPSALLVPRPPSPAPSALVAAPPSMAEPPPTLPQSLPLLPQPSSPLPQPPTPLLPSPSLVPRPPSPAPPARVAAPPSMEEPPPALPQSLPLLPQPPTPRVVPQPTTLHVGAGGGRVEIGAQNPRIGDSGQEEDGMAEECAR